MKWMIDSDFFNERIAMKCKTAGCAHDNTSERKLLALIQLFCDSVNGKSWRDAEDLALMLRRPRKQCKQVWEICMEENVLRPVEDGYSAIEWLREKGYFSDDWRNRDQGYMNPHAANASQYRPAPQQISKNAF